MGKASLPIIREYNKVYKRECRQKMAYNDIYDDISDMFPLSAPPYMTRMFSGSDIELLLNELESGRFECVTTEDVELLLEAKTQLIASCGDNGAVNRTWTLYPCGGTPMHGAGFMTSFYGDTGPSASMRPSLTVPIRSANDLKKWEKLVTKMPETTTAHCVKIRLFPWMAENEGTVPWRYFLITQMTAEDVLQEFKTVAESIVQDIIIWKISESIRSGTAIYREYDIPVTESDLIAYFKKENPRRRAAVRRQMDTLDAIVKDSLCGRRILDIMLRNNRQLCNVDELQDAIERLENGELCVSRTESVQKKFFPHKTIFDNGDGAWQFKQESKEDATKILASLNGNDELGYLYTIEIPVHFADKESAEQRADSLFPDIVYIPCAKISLFSDILVDKWEYILPTRNGNDIDEIRKSFGFVCFEIIRCILLDKLEKVKTGEIVRKARDTGWLIGKYDLLAFFQRGDTADENALSIKITELSELISKYNDSRQIFGGVLRITNQQ